MCDTHIKLDPLLNHSQTANEKVEIYLSSLEKESHFAEVYLSQPPQRESQNLPSNNSVPKFSISQLDQPRQIIPEQSNTFLVETSPNPSPLQPQPLPYIQNQQTNRTTNSITEDHISNSSKGSSNISNRSEPVDKFIDKLVEGQETFIPDNKESTSLYYMKSLQQELETRGLPVVELVTFDGNPCYWPEFIADFKTRIHFKKSFTDNMRMERRRKKIN